MGSSELLSTTFGPVRTTDNRLQTDRQTESDAYEPTVQFTQVGSTKKQRHSMKSKRPCLQHWPNIRCVRGGPDIPNILISSEPFPNIPIHRTLARVSSLYSLLPLGLMLILTEFSIRLLIVAKRERAQYWCSFCLALHLL